MERLRGVATLIGLTRFFSLFLLGVAYFPLSGVSACTEQMVKGWGRQNRNWRLQFLANAGLMPVYEVSSAAHTAPICPYLSVREKKDWDEFARQSLS